MGRLLICLLVMFVASAQGASSYFYDSEEPYGGNMLDGAGKWIHVYGILSPGATSLFNCSKR